MTGEEREKLREIFEELFKEHEKEKNISPSVQQRLRTFKDVLKKEFLKGWENRVKDA